MTSQSTERAPSHALTPQGVVIEEIHDIERLGEMETLQMRVWGFEPRGAVPAHMLFIVGATGGIVLGASVDGVLVGFALGVLARHDGRLYHASHMLGVLPEYNGRGIGAALKWRQRENALRQGLDRMTWTFDPLEARNAYFNLHKLGTISRTYYENYYGNLADNLNHGLPTDRLLVEWRLRDEAPRHNTPNRAPIPILQEEAGRPVLELDLAHDGAALSVKAPADVQRLKRNDPDAALAWRLAIREALSWGLARGYTVCDFAGGSYVLSPETGD